jgi:hypothetical protein
LLYESNTANQWMGKRLSKAILFVPGMGAPTACPMAVWRQMQMQRLKNYPVTISEEGDIRLGLNM